MSAKSHRFKVGDVDCLVLLDGAFLRGREGIVRRFPDASESDYVRAYADIGLSLDEADTSFNILLMRVGADVVLVDTGEAGKPHGGYLLESLRCADVQPEDVTLVVLTHSHGDHVLGLLSDAGEPTFPNARYVMSSVEMDVWRARAADNAQHQALITLLDSRGVQLIAMDAPILDGLTAIPLAGHTRGQIGLRLESHGETLLHLADVLHSPMQFAHPEWSASFDADTSVSVPTRRDALSLASDTQALTLFYHLTFPGLGWVKRVNEGFVWTAAPSGY